MSGSSLVFDSVGRGHIGTYLCIASNGVPPSVSKRVQLKVQCKYQFVLLDIRVESEVLAYFHAVYKNMKGVLARTAFLNLFSSKFRLIYDLEYILSVKNFFFPFFKCVEK